MKPRLPTFSKIAATLASSSKEIARALPDSKGGETAKQLQTYRTQISSYFTDPNEPVTKLLYSAENWVKIKLKLRTAGPVAVGTNANLTPILSGKGALLVTDEEEEFFVAKGARIYIASETVNRITVVVEPIPWLEQLSMEMTGGLQVVSNGIAAAKDTLAALLAPRGHAVPSAQNLPTARPIAGLAKRGTRI